MLVPLAILIFGRDFALSLSAFYIRYASLPEPVSMVYLNKKADAENLGSLL